MNNIAKVIDLVGTSDVSIEDAINGAIERAAETLENLQWFQVIETRGSIVDQKIQRYQVILKVAFGLND
ncbi:MAG: dodecin domain-containing protein [Sphingomonas sp.]|nr:dodecin domain-containing protein [Sphingomonas sp.]